MTPISKQLIQEKIVDKGTIHLRRMDLTALKLKELMSVLHETHDEHQFKSISFSFNPNIKDDGIAILINNLPNDIEELGLVSCGIGDDGAEHILSKLPEFSNLKMLCLEENLFSEKSKNAFKRFRTENPNVLVVL